MKIELRYCRAKGGLKKAHVVYPTATNHITLCRRCQNFDLITEKEFKNKPCSFCLRRLPPLRTF